MPAALTRPPQPIAEEADAAGLTVTAWRDEIVENLPGATPTASEEALIWWTPSVGPTGMLMAHRFAAYASAGPTTWTVTDTAATFGLGASAGRVARTLVRLEHFGIVCCDGSTIAVRLRLPPLNRHQRACLPHYLAGAFDAPIDVPRQSHRGRDLRRVRLGGDVAERRRVPRHRSRGVLRSCSPAQGARRMSTVPRPGRVPRLRPFDSRTGRHLGWPVPNRTLQRRPPRR